MQTPALRARRGFTLLEMILSMTLMLAFLGMTAELFRKQSNSVSDSAGRLDAQQNARFAISALERELRMAGLGVPDAQPLLVQAGELAITFNADLVALDTGDLAAVYINPDADSAAVGVLRKSDRVTLPTVTTLYPDTTYEQSLGVPSNAETISYWLSHDSTSSHSDEYILFRRVNARPARVVARGIKYNSGDSLFTYYKDSSGTLTPVNPVALPLVHSATIHGSAADTGKSAMTDSIRQVKVRFNSVYHDPRTGKDVERAVQTTIHLMNAGLIHHSSCGTAPLSASAVTATFVPAALGGPFVTLTWNPSIDDGAGEKDVERYAIYRRLSPATTFDQPFASVPAGAATYSYTDADVVSGQTWIYAVAAQDCTPSTSPKAEASPVVIP